jgi:fucose 4-O-acetylase-like acetyltransferase
VLRLHWVVLPLSVVVSLLGGLWSAQLFCFARALGLLPFFVVGLFLTRENLARLQDRWARAAALVALVAISVLARSTDEWARTAFLYYDAGYADLGVSPLPGIWIRLAVIAVGLAGAFAALACVPGHAFAVTAWGSATLVVYLFHGFFVRLSEHLGLADWAVDSGGPGIAVVTAGAVALALVLASPWARRWLEHAVDPVSTWRTHRRERRTSLSRGLAPVE